VSKHYNEKWVNCKHQDAVILVGSCKQCNKERARNRAPAGIVRFKEGYHHGLGMHISTERQLYTEASKANGTVRWS
jgi:hypothetical protein